MLRAAALVAGKDLRIEARSRVATNQVLPFALVVLLLFAFALDPDRGTLRAATPGLLWVAVLFTARHRRPAVLRPRGGRRRPRRPAGLSGPRPRRRLPRQGRRAGRRSCSCSRCCSASACVLLYDADLRGRGRRAARRHRRRDDGRPGGHGYALRCPRRRRRSPGDAAPAAPAPGGGAGADRRYESHRSRTRYGWSGHVGGLALGRPPRGVRSRLQRGRACWPSGRSWRTHDHRSPPPARGARGSSAWLGPGGHRRWLAAVRPRAVAGRRRAGRGRAHAVRPRAVGLAGLPRLLRHRSSARCCYLVPKTRSLAWDRVAGASAEIGVLFTGPGPGDRHRSGATSRGASSGRWDARLTSTALLFLLFLGYLALRRLPASPDVRAKRAAIAGHRGLHRRADRAHERGVVAHAAPEAHDPAARSRPADRRAHAVHAVRRAWWPSPSCTCG